MTVTCDSVHDQLVTQFAGWHAADIIHDESADLAGLRQPGLPGRPDGLIPEDLKADVPADLWTAVSVRRQDLRRPRPCSSPTWSSPTRSCWTKAGIAVPTARRTLDAGTTSRPSPRRSPTGGQPRARLGPAVRRRRPDDEPGPQLRRHVLLRRQATRPPSPWAPPSSRCPPVSTRWPTTDHGPQLDPVSGSDILPGFFGGKYAMFVAGNSLRPASTASAPEGFDWAMLPLAQGQHADPDLQPADPLASPLRASTRRRRCSSSTYFMQAQNLAAVAQGDCAGPGHDVGLHAVVESTWPASRLGRHPASSSKLLDSALPEVRRSYPQWKDDSSHPGAPAVLREPDRPRRALTTQLTDGWNTVRRPSNRHRVGGSPEPPADIRRRAGSSGRHAERSRIRHACRTKAIGSLAGAAVGDATRRSHRRLDTREIQRALRRLGRGHRRHFKADWRNARPIAPYHKGDGHVTDDTLMTHALVAGVRARTGATSTRTRWPSTWCR